MTPNEIFKEILKDAIFVEKYGFIREELDKLEMHEASEPIFDIIKLIIQEGGIKSDAILYNQIKKIQNLK
ncbi:hypothetical protein IR083_21210 [Dysgonomonas sp. GY75]|uniref:hypothetical protein n=1 Tax=Dysgonomonas sp. GY75 TaxID=2780419 RepID=UPI001884648F|nr:hypothetical protein [Dysgonomonas sp. GY75]MBF0651339.1 hypothetical protein [Dysgonomonas sp. GY75]